MPACHLHVLDITANHCVSLACLGQHCEFLVVHSLWHDLVTSRAISSCCCLTLRRARIIHGNLRAVTTALCAQCVRIVPCFIYVHMLLDTCFFHHLLAQRPAVEAFIPHVHLDLGSPGWNWRRSLAVARHSWPTRFNARSC